MAANQLYGKLEAQMRARYQFLVEQIREEYLRSSNQRDADWDEAVKDEGDLSVADILADFNLQQMDQRGRELHALEDALDRLHDGTFGDCDDCGEKIDPRRLEVQPISRLCIRCANAKERSRS